ncbi:hypothetical protein ONZ45_g14642 [Pleurotus djamor]|nr:hypothetical protein ONZ45_g14642 [Pleurotus djamor]
MSTNTTNTTNTSNTSNDPSSPLPHSNPNPNPNPNQVDILILGGGWTSTFLIPLCEARGVRYAVTSRTGRSGTIKFEFDQTLDLGLGVVADRDRSGGVEDDRDGNRIADKNGVGPRDPRTEDASTSTLNTKTHAHDADTDAQVDREVNVAGEVDADPEGFHRLPKAQTVLITFPITKPGAVGRLVRMYVGRRSRDGGEGDGVVGGEEEVNFIQLGTTSIWNGVSKNHIVAEKHVTHAWYERHSPYTRTDRAASEEELLALDDTFFTSHGANTQDAKNTETQTRIRIRIRTTVLNLSGLWGGTRDPRHWVERIAPSKEVLRNKGSIHMIHGSDLARAILAVHDKYTPSSPSTSSTTTTTTTTSSSSSSSSSTSSRGEWRAGGERWLITDGRVYDWWDLIAAWGAPSTTSTSSSSPHPTTSSPSSNTQPTPPNRIQWVFSLLSESSSNPSLPPVRALPRDVELLGRCLDSREFWGVFGVCPERGRLELVGGEV